MFGVTEETILSYMFVGDEMSGDETGSETDDDDVIVDGQPRKRRRKKCKKVDSVKVSSVRNNRWLIDG